MQLKEDIAGQGGDQELRSILDSFRHVVQVMRTFSAHSEAEVGLTAAQLFALQVLARHSRLSVNDLAARTLTHQSSVSVVVRRLVEKGLVIKSPSERDRRQVELSLTPAGRKLVEKAPSAVQDRLIEALVALPPNDRHALAELLNRVVQQVAPEGRAPTMFFDADPETHPSSEG